MRSRSCDISLPLPISTFGIVMCSLRILCDNLFRTAVNSITRFSFDHSNIILPITEDLNLRNRHRTSFLLAIRARFVIAKFKISVTSEGAAKIQDLMQRGKNRVFKATNLNNAPARGFSDFAGNECEFLIRDMFVMHDYF